MRWPHERELFAASLSRQGFSASEVAFGVYVAEAEPFATPGEVAALVRQYCKAMSADMSRMGLFARIRKKKRAV